MKEKVEQNCIKVLSLCIIVLVVIIIGLGFKWLSGARQVNGEDTEFLYKIRLGERFEMSSYPWYYTGKPNTNGLEGTFGFYAGYGSVTVWFHDGSIICIDKTFYQVVELTSNYVILKRVKEP